MRRLAWGLSLLAVLSGCAPVTRVILLPDAQGRATSVQVQGASSAQVLAQPYAVAAVERNGAVQLATTTEAEVQAQHGGMLALQPPPAQRFVLQFEPGSSTLTADSQSQLEGILAQALARPGGEIVVVGHTDRTGSPQANDALSLQRARAVRELLIARGFQPELIEAVGRGEREPVVPTEPNVDEPRNRRAEIIVR
ncbi:OmpA family protein [Rhodoferax saidenbachensis]|uniref:Outer membrane protein OmpA-like peptidoglycan-associated protein n=1 Tax=Rhodoferax saidenbachensis TaxID=1484693 RepID=A0ABU1ZLM6_9BURK|nr:OmpA family protein [Rhodoferax saidenbachensis]MDR7306440.1 outer membrane protein OmpA-like peptidoglycan-associated protein [Rhodoferax saidenbachensis]